MTGWRLLVTVLRPARRDLLTLTAGSILVGAPTLASGLIVSRALDDGFVAGHPATGVWWLVALGALGVLAAFVSQSLLPVMARVVEPMRDRLATMAVTTGLSRVVNDESARDSSGAMAVRATEHVESVRTLIIALLRSAFSMVLTIVLALVGLATLVPRFVLAVLPFMVIGGTAYIIVVRRLIHRQRELLLAEEHIGDESQTVLVAQRDIVAYGALETALGPALDGIDAAAAAAGRTTRLGWWRSLIPAAAIQAPVLLLLALAPYLVHHAGLSVGDLVGGVIYIVRGLAPAIGFLVSGGAGWIVQLSLAADRLASQVGEDGPGPVRPEAGGVAGRSEVPAPAGPLDLHAVDLGFAYSPQAEPVLHHAEITVPFGTHLVIVGPSGVGKSTLAALLVGVRTPQRGIVALAGRSIGSWPAQLIHRTIAFVPQEAYVFSGTVRENLAYLNPGATDTAIVDAVRRFGLDPVVDRLGGLDAVIAPGGDALSAGERQQIALTRTWLSPAGIVVLDEATCHLDPATEEAAEAQFRARGGTLIVVAHRISSAMRADRVAIVENGLISTGTHQHLAGRNATYARLVDYWDATRRVDALDPS